MLGTTVKHASSKFVDQDLCEWCCRWLHLDTWLGRSVAASVAMDAALLCAGQPHVLQQQLLAAAALKMMGHCDHQGGGTLQQYQSAAIALAVSLEAQVRQLHPCA